MYAFLEPTPHGRVGHAEHAPAHAVAVPTMTGIAVERDHGVLHDAVEELLGIDSRPGLLRGGTGLHQRQEGVLVFRGNLGEGPLVLPVRHHLESTEPLRVECTVRLEIRRKLSVDEGEGASPGGPWILVGRNDPVAHSAEGVGFFFREDPPRRPGPLATSGSGDGRRGRRRLQERPSRDAELGLHGRSPEPPRMARSRPGHYQRSAAVRKQRSRARWYMQTTRTANPALTVGHPRSRVAVGRPRGGPSQHLARVPGGERKAISHSIPRRQQPVRTGRAAPGAPSPSRILPCRSTGSASTTAPTVHTRPMKCDSTARPKRS